MKVKKIKIDWLKEYKSHLTGGRTKMNKTNKFWKRPCGGRYMKLMRGPVGGGIIDGNGPLIEKRPNKGF